MKQNKKHSVHLKLALQFPEEMYLSSFIYQVADLSCELHITTRVLLKLLVTMDEEDSLSETEVKEEFVKFKKVR